MALELLCEQETPLSEAVLATSTLPAPIAPSPAPAYAALAQWQAQRASLAEEIRVLERRSASILGATGWNDYVASDACRNMMRALSTYALLGAESRLADHWRLIFGGSVIRATLKAFQSKLTIRVMFPSPLSHRPDSVLRGIFIERKGDGCVRTLEGLEGLTTSDARFPSDKAVIVLSWDTVSPWSVIAPGAAYQQLTGFQYADAKGKTWDTGCVFSEVVMANSGRSPVREHLAEAERVASILHEDLRIHERVDNLNARIARLDQKIALWSAIAIPEKQFTSLTRQAEMFEAGDRAAPRGLLLTGPPGTGKTMIASSFAQSMQCDFQQLSIADLKQQQLGASGQKVREVWDRARAHQPAVIFLDECEGVLGRRGAAETDVISTDIVQAFLAEWDRGTSSDRILVIGATNRPDMLDDAILSRFGNRVEIALPGALDRKRIFENEMQTVFPDIAIPEDMPSLTQGMSGRDLRHLASQVRTLAYPGAPAASHFYEAAGANRKANNTRVDTAATWDTLVVEPSVLARLKLTCSLLRDAESWKARGVQVPNSLLLTGPAGTGKTQIARTLANESGLSFLAATTADMKAGFLGQSGNRVKQLFERARGKAPVILFLDELDIVAPDRGGSNDALTEEIVGQLLQEMDGIESHDGQVFLLAATNHAEEIDRAVLSRFRETIHVPLPGLEARAKLLTILLGKKQLGFQLEAGAQTLALAGEGKNMSGRDLQNWVGRAEQKALLRALETGGPEHFRLRLEDFD